MRPKFNHEWLEFLCPFGTAAHPDTRRRVESRWVGLGWVPEFLTYPTLGWVPVFDNPTYPTTRWVRVTRRVSPTGRGLYVKYILYYYMLRPPYVYLGFPRDRDHPIGGP